MVLAASIFNVPPSKFAMPVPTSIDVPVQVLLVLGLTLSVPLAPTTYCPVSVPGERRYIPPPVTFAVPLLLNGTTVNAGDPGVFQLIVPALLNALVPKPSLSTAVEAPVV